MAEWTPTKILEITDDIEQSIMNKIKEGNLTSTIETGDLYYAVQYSMDSMSNASSALREHLNSMNKNIPQYKYDLSKIMYDRFMIRYITIRDLIEKYKEVISINDIKKIHTIINRIKSDIETQKHIFKSEEYIYYDTLLLGLRICNNTLLLLAEEK